MTPPPTHYEVLGVPADASTDDVHRAYLAEARRQHPDHNPGSDTSSAAMARVNEAWRVLGHPGRRRQYDRELRGERPYLGGTAHSSGADTGFGQEPSDDDLVDVIPAGGHSVLGFLPWLLVFGALAVIFVFTAYAASGGGAPDPDNPSLQSRLGECIVITSARPTVAAIDCAVGNDGQVVDEVKPGDTCPVDTRQLELPAETKTLCLAG